MASLETLAEAWSVRQARHEPILWAIYPRATEAVSVTGKQCGLNCAHCGGHYLESMTPLADFLSGSDSRGHADGVDGGGPGTRSTAGKSGLPTSCLVSGGCDREGRVPLGRHMESLRSLHASGLKLNLHAGLVDEEEAEELASVAEVVSFDFVGDDEAIRDVYGLDKTVADYMASYRALRRHVRVVPHITIGLNGGRHSGELRALELLGELGVDEIAFLALVPTPGTRFAGSHAPGPERVAEVVARARLLFPDIEISLGCMRPKGADRLAIDRAGIDAGVNKLVVPPREALNYASKRGLEVRFGDECCVF